MNSTRTGSAGQYPRRRSPNGVPSPEADARMEAALKTANAGGVIYTPQERAARAEGYAALPVGTEFVIIQGWAIPAKYVAGRRVGDRIIKALSDTTYEVYTREETEEERAARPAREQQAARKVVSGFDPFDCQEAVWEMA